MGWDAGLAQGTTRGVSSEQNTGHTGEFWGGEGEPHFGGLPELRCRVPTLVPRPRSRGGETHGAAPTLTVGVRQAWRGALARRRCRYLRAAYTIMAYYKRHKVKAYLRELLRRFQAVRTLPDFGKSVVWPEPPAVLARFQDASQRLFRRYRPESCSTPGLGWGRGMWIWDGDVVWECAMGTWDRDGDVGQGWGCGCGRGMWNGIIRQGCGLGMWDRDLGWGCGMWDGDMG